jgi:hypothetical protein
MYGRLGPELGRVPDADLQLRTGIAPQKALLRNLLQGSAEELRRVAEEKPDR